MINTVTTTQIQRKPSTLSMNEGEDHKYILKNGEVISVLFSPQKAEMLLKQANIQEKRSLQLSPKTLKKIQAIDPIEFQESLRNEE